MCDIQKLLACENFNTMANIKRWRRHILNPPKCNNVQYIFIVKLLLFHFFLQLSINFCHSHSLFVAYFLRCNLFVGASNSIKWFYCWACCWCISIVISGTRWKALMQIFILSNHILHPHIQSSLYGGMKWIFIYIFIYKQSSVDGWTDGIGWMDGLKWNLKKYASMDV